MCEVTIVIYSTDICIVGQLSLRVAGHIHNSESPHTFSSAAACIVLESKSSSRLFARSLTRCKASLGSSSAEWLQSGGNVEQRLQASGFRLQTLGAVRCAAWLNAELRASSGELRGQHLGHEALSQWGVTSACDAPLQASCLLVGERQQSLN